MSGLTGCMCPHLVSLLHLDVLHHISVVKIHACHWQDYSQLPIQASYMNSATYRKYAVSIRKLHQTNRKWKKISSIIKELQKQINIPSKELCIWSILSKTWSYAFELKRAVNIQKVIRFGSLPKKVENKTYIRNNW